MAIWLADMDLKLTEVEHFSEMNICAKMRQLQVHTSFSPGGTCKYSYIETGTYLRTLNDILVNFCLKQ